MFDSSVESLNFVRYSEVVDPGRCASGDGQNEEFDRNMKR